MDRELLELYTDYLISSFSYTTATGLSKFMDGTISHDKITRFLSKLDYASKDLWQVVKSKVRQIESEEGVLIFDDTIMEKPYTDENEIICWHFDHTKGLNIKGVNILNCLYYAQGISIPVAFEIICKDQSYRDPKDGHFKRRASITKNEHLRSILEVCAKNRLKYKYVLTDSWFCSKENMLYIKHDLSKEFIMAVKENRTVALSLEDKLKGNFVRIDSLQLEPNTTLLVYLKGVDFAVLLLKQVFTNKDGSEGVMYLVCSETSLSYHEITTIYQKRWKVEEFHKSIKSNTALGKSPTRTVRTQSNHFFASIYAFFKLEEIKIKHNLNHFAIKIKLYISALKASFEELQKLNKCHASNFYLKCA